MLGIILEEITTYIQITKPIEKCNRCNVFLCLKLIKCNNAIFIVKMHDRKVLEILYKLYLLLLKFLEKQERKFLKYVSIITNVPTLTEYCY